MSRLYKWLASHSSRARNLTKLSAVDCSMEQLSAPKRLDPIVTTRLVTQSTRGVPHTVPVIGLSGRQTQNQSFTFPSNGTSTEPGSLESTSSKNDHHTEQLGENSTSKFPPQLSGYSFAVAGNKYLTLRCRKLAPHAIAVYRPKSERAPIKQIGSYVPNDVFEKANVDFKEAREKIKKKLYQAIDRKYVDIPFLDRINICHMILSDSPYVTGDALLQKLDAKVHTYICNEYTPYRSLLRRADGGTKEEFLQVRQKVSEVLESWGVYDGK